MPRLPISVAMMIKNEEAFLGKAIESVAPYVSELVVVDSGSTDRSLEIVESFRVLIPSLMISKIEWKNDYSWARNEAITLCSQPWIFFLDGDEVVDPKGWKAIEDELKSPSTLVYDVIQRNYTLDPHLMNAVVVAGTPPGCPVTTTLYQFENRMDRFLKNDSRLRYSGIVHESLEESLKALNLKRGSLEVILHHWGRLKPGSEEIKKNLYLKLADQKIKDQPNDPAALLEWAVAMSENQRGEEALQFLNSHPLTQQHAEIRRVRAHLLLEKGEFAKAEEDLSNLVALFPQHIPLREMLTTALLYQRKFKETQIHCEQILKTPSESFLAYFHLGLIHLEEKRWSEAKHFLQKAAEIRPTDSIVQRAIHSIPV